MFYLGGKGIFLPSQGFLALQKLRRAFSVLVGRCVVIGLAGLLCLAFQAATEVRYGNQNNDQKEQAQSQIRHDEHKFFGNGVHSDPVVRF